MTELSDDDLLDRVRGLVRQSNEVTVELLRHLGEVEGRKLYARDACSSLFTWCVTVLGLSEDATYKRITAARAARRFPVLLERLAKGSLHLTGICLLAPHLDEENHLELVAAASGRSKRQIEELLADRRPRPDAPARIRKLPIPSHAGSDGRSTGTSDPLPILFAGTERPVREELAPGRVAKECPTLPPTPPPTPPPPRARGRIEPLGVSRHKVQFTADKAWVDKLREATALLSHRLPDGDMTAVLEQALTVLCETLMKERFAMPTPSRMAAAPRDEAPTEAVSPEAVCPEAMGGSRYIPASVRRQVVQRDGLRCTFVGPHGRRCEETRLLELHHCRPWAMGGPNSADNLTLRCRCHNGQAALLDFGPRVPTAAGH